MSPKIARKVIREFQTDGVDEQYLLSHRETEIVKEIENGLTYKDIATRLGISPHTVHTHIKNIYEKLHAKDRQGALVAVAGAAQAKPHRASDNASHVCDPSDHRSALRLALAQAISLTTPTRPQRAPSVPTQHGAPASPASQKAGIKAGTESGCSSEHPMKSKG